MLDPVMLDAQAGQCGRCRGELGVAGRVCQHCRLDEQFVGWEVRIYSLQTHAMAAGQAVTAEEAIIRVSPLFALPTLSALSDPPISSQMCLLRGRETERISQRVHKQSGQVCK